jgi:rhodanese-related sulfurtransferase
MNTQTLDVNTLKEILDRSREDVQLIDVRSAREFDEGHLPGAINMPLEQVESRLQDMDHGKRAVLLCQSGRRAGICHEILSRHRDDLAVLEGGTTAWVQAGMPVVKTTANRLPLIRQVQIGAGSLVLLGTLLGAFVNPLWLLLSGFVGTGLLTAGTTGFCGMAVLLERMPWNRATSLNCEVAK